MGELKILFKDSVLEPDDTKDQAPCSSELHNPDTISYLHNHVAINHGRVKDSFQGFRTTWA